MKAVSIIIPTLNEAGNIEPLIGRIFSVMQKKSIMGEIIVVDDGSRDGTREKVTALSKQYPITLKCRDDKKGLASAVVEGAHLARHEIVVVMDGDLSHPPEAIPRLVTSLEPDNVEMVIGSRYAPGGTTPKWPLKRKIASKLASFPAQLLTGIEDPLSGFFAVSRSKLVALRPDVPGYKIGLELLLGQNRNIQVREVPIAFHDRNTGTSKMTMSVIRSYFAQLTELCGISFQLGFWWLFATLMSICFLVDTLIYWTCISLGLSQFLSHCTALSGSIVFACGLTATRFMHQGRTISSRIFCQPSTLIWGLGLLIFRTGIFVFSQNLGWSHWPGFPAFAATTFSAIAIPLFLLLASPILTNEVINQGLRFRLLLITVICASLSLRFLFAGSFELLKEEAYYWNYAQHLDIGYLDHPPMVAVLIKIGTTLFGNSEFGVRVGAIFCWCIATVFVYRYARDISSRDTALQAATIMSVLPAFFVFGFLMTPDAPLIACWAGALFFARRALLSEDKTSWLGLGVCIGLGLFSKYTIALLGPALLTFLIIDPAARRWLLKPQPYFAAAIAVLIFSPVIIWNIQHDWASFLFQTHDRLTSSSEFSSHELLASIFILLSPVGFFGAMYFLIYPKQFISLQAFTKRQYTFALISIIVPLAIFLVFSLTKEGKLNWTSPIWLAIVPFLAVTLSQASNTLKTQTRIRFFKAWKATIIVFLLAYGGMLQYFSIGLPGLAYAGEGPLLGWRDFAAQIDTIEDSIEEETGKRPLVVGMDQYKTASGLAFYRTLLFEEESDSRHKHPLTDTLGRSLLGREAVMYGFWFPEFQKNAQPLLVISPDKEDLEEKWLYGKAADIGIIQTLETTKNKFKVGPMFYRLINVKEQNRNIGYLEKLSFRPDSALSVKIFSSK